MVNTTISFGGNGHKFIRKDWIGANGSRHWVIKTYQYGKLKKTQVSTENLGFDFFRYAE